MKSKREKKAPLAQNDQVLYNIRHSLSHILAMAVLELRPDAKLGVGPVIDNGFYYDFALPKPLTDEDLPKIESTMRRIIAQNLAFEQQFMSRPEADEFFKNQPYKRELIQEKTLDNTGNQSDKVQVYKTGLFIDFCKGGHVGSTSEIPPDAFKLDKVAGAYWKGSEKNDMLTRIYGIAFANKQGLEAFVAQQAEAAKRDHRKLGKDLDLFFFSELVGAGLPLWTPKGTLLRNLLDDYVWELRKARGYEQVDIPHITKKDLYEISGHWAKFKDELFKIETREKHLLVMKPMNCPHHTQIYARKPWSYREIPQRYASITKVYRDEQSGELAGLSRVRAITQDDAHVFCRSSPIG